MSRCRRKTAVVAPARKVPTILWAMPRTNTPWWFPSETKGGARMEDRLVFPIPPGTHWSDTKPIVLPRDTHMAIAQASETKQIEDKAPRRTVKKITPSVVAVKKRLPLAGGLAFGSPVAARAQAEKPKREKKPKMKNDPTFVAAARELRDRWLEKMNSGQYLPEAAGKYDVSRALEEKARVELVEPMKLLNAA